MAEPQYVIVELKVDASDAQKGASDYEAALDKAQAAADSLTSSAGKAQAAITSQGTAMTRAAAANDNLATSYRAANDNFSEFGKSLADRAIDFINNVNHLKLMAAAAYAMSPAFRSFANTEVLQLLQLVGVNIGVASQAFATLARVVSPALSFFARIAGPIAVAVAAWEAFNYVLKTGSDLLDKYAQSYRIADISEDLKKLTQFQTDTISASQVQYATELGARLATAKQTINDFFKVQIDVTNVALYLQSIWVGIVEQIAKAVSLASQLPNTNNMNYGGDYGAATTGMPSAPYSAPTGKGSFDVNSPAYSMLQNARNYQAAYSRLAAALGAANFDDKGKPVGTTFDARFGAAVTDLANPDNKKDKSNSYDRAVQSVKDQISLLDLEAQGAGKTTEAYQELKVAHDLNIAAMKAGIEVTPQMRAEWKSLADQIADLTIKTNQYRVLQEETFKSQTQFLSPSQQAAANAARQIDPNNWMAHLNDAGPKLAELNSQLTQARDLSYNFLDTFDQGLIKGESAAQAFHDALTNIANTLLQMAEKQLVNAAFGPLINGGSGGAGAGIFSGIAKLFGFQSGGSFIVPAGAGALALPGFAAGTDFTVPGSGGADSKVTAFRVSPGERVTVTPPGRGSSSGGGAIQIQIATTVDKSGNLQSYVTGVAGQVAGQTIQLATPGIVKQSVGAVQGLNKNAPAFLRKAV